MFYTKEQFDVIVDLLQRKYDITIDKQDAKIVSLHTDELNAIDPDDGYIYFGTITIISGNTSIVCKVLPPVMPTGEEETIFDNTTAAGAGIPTNGEYHNIFFNRAIPSDGTEGIIKFDGYKLKISN